METGWKRYDRGLLERLRYDFPEPHFKVHGTVASTPHRVRGRLSLAWRQLDAAVYRSGERAPPFLIADAKFYTDRIDVKDVEAFIGLMEDVGATLGELASPKGGSAAAEPRAEAADARICIMSFDEALTFRWYPVAREVFPYDWFFHEQLARAIRALNTSGCPQEVQSSLENISFEEWESFVWWALQHHPEEGVSFVVWVARYHYDDGWVTLGQLVIDPETGEEREEFAQYLCRRCASEARA